MSDAQPTEQDATIDSLNASLQAKTKDGEAAKTWHNAAADAPDIESVSALHERLESLQMQRDHAYDEYAKACVTRACVFGWTKVSEEQNVSSKQLHAWHKKYLPDMPDLSSIPDREMKREARRIAEIENQLKTNAELRKRLKHHQERLTKLEEGVKK